MSKKLFISEAENLKVKLTHNKLTDVLPFHVTSSFMDNGDSDSPLEALWKWSQIGVGMSFSFFTVLFFIFDEMLSTYLVQ